MTSDMNEDLTETGPDAVTRLHANCVDFAGVGVLLRGPSGAGKSDLTLRLLDLGARLVADDQVFVFSDD
ncbi:MAG: hypothetical protein WEB93_04010, partial [Sphingomonadales bacterium]